MLELLSNPPLLFNWMFIIRHCHFIIHYPEHGFPAVGTQK